MKISVKNILVGIAVFFLIIIALVFLPRIFHKFNKRSTTATSSHQIQGLNPDTISVGFYNVENLFDLNYDGGEYPEYRPGALGWNQQTFDIKLANISSAIMALRVDIIGLCEIENRNALEALRSTLNKAGDEFPFFAIADFPGKGSTCPSLLSKYPIVRSRDLRARGSRQGRKKHSRSRHRLRGSGHAQGICQPLAFQGAPGIAAPGHGAGAQGAARCASGALRLPYYRRSEHRLRPMEQISCGRARRYKRHGRA